MVYSCSRILVSVLNELTGAGTILDCQPGHMSMHIMLSKAKEVTKLHRVINVTYVNIKILII